MLNKFNAVFLDSLLEIKSRKIIYIYAVITAFMILLFALIPAMQIQGENLFESDLLGAGLLDTILSHFFDGFIGFVIFLMVFGSPHGFRFGVFTAVVPGQGTNRTDFIETDQPLANSDDEIYFNLPDPYGHFTPDCLFDLADHIASPGQFLVVDLIRNVFLICTFSIYLCLRFCHRGADPFGCTGHHGIFRCPIRRQPA